MTVYFPPNLVGLNTSDCTVAIPVYPRLNLVMVLVSRQPHHGEYRVHGYDKGADSSPLLLSDVAHRASWRTDNVRQQLRDIMAILCYQIGPINCACTAVLISGSYL